MESDDDDEGPVGLHVYADSDGRYRFPLPQSGTGAIRRDRFVIPPLPVVGLASARQPFSTGPPAGSAAVPDDPPAAPSPPGLIDSPTQPSSPDHRSDDAWCNSPGFLDAPPDDMPDDVCPSGVDAPDLAPSDVSASTGTMPSSQPVPRVSTDSDRVSALIMANRTAALARRRALVASSLTPEQHQAVEVATSGAHLFLSGQAGTGKSRALLVHPHGFRILDCYKVGIRLGIIDGNPN